jgi:hypothetical protein
MEERAERSLKKQSPPSVGVGSELDAGVFGFLVGLQAFGAAFASEA